MTPKERPILFSGAMVKAILGGRKTQTRRVVDLRKLERGRDPSAEAIVSRLACPYGTAGDRLWVKETFAPHPQHPDALTMPEYEGGHNQEHLLYRADAQPFVHLNCEQSVELIDGYDADRLKWRTPIYMPRWASRVTLQITSIHVERLLDISETDARAEGIEPKHFGSFAHPYLGGSVSGRPAAHSFFVLWNEINGKRRGCAYDDNPWVWVVEFWRRLEAA